MPVAWLGRGYCHLSPARQGLPFFLVDWVGAGTQPRGATFAEVAVAAQAPASRLPTHPIISADPADPDRRFDP